MCMCVCVFALLYLCTVDSDNRFRLDIRRNMHVYVCNHEGDCLDRSLMIGFILCSIIFLVIWRVTYPRTVGDKIDWQDELLYSSFYLGRALSFVHHAEARYVFVIMKMRNKCLFVVFSLSHHVNRSLMFLLHVVPLKSKSYGTGLYRPRERERTREGESVKAREKEEER
jgi:hypothetical protein